MAEVKCLYCGDSMPEDVDRCPHCDAPSHFQRRGIRYGARRRFLIFFIAVALFTIIMAFVAPR